MMTLLALLVLPGTIIGIAAQLPLRLAVTTSIPVSFGVAAIAGYVFGRLGVTWTLIGYVVATAAVAAVVGVVGLLIAAPAPAPAEALTREAGPAAGDAARAASGVAVGAGVADSAAATRTLSALSVRADARRGGGCCPAPRCWSAPG